MCLKSHHVVHAFFDVLLSQLYHSIWCFPRFGIRQADRFQRTVSQCVIAASRHDFHRHTSLKDLFVHRARLALTVKRFQRRRLSRQQRMIKSIILFSVHGAVDITRLPFAVTGSDICLSHINACRIHNRRSRIEEMQIGFPQHLPQTRTERIGG